MRFLLVIAFVSLSANVWAQTPTPIQKKAPAWTAPQQGTPVMRDQRSPQYGNWQRFQGATRCEQIDNVLTCDNGYRGTIR